MPFQTRCLIPPLSHFLTILSHSLPLISLHYIIPSITALCHLLFHLIDIYLSIYLFDYPLFFTYHTTYISIYKINICQVTGMRRETVSLSITLVDRFLELINILDFSIIDETTGEMRKEQEECQPSKQIQ